VTFGSFVLDANTARFVGSDELASVLGFTPGEVVLTAMMVTAHLHPAEQSRWQGGLQRCLETGRPQVVEHRIITADRSERPASTTLTAQGTDRRPRGGRPGTRFTAAPGHCLHGSG